MKMISYLYNKQLTRCIFYCIMAMASCAMDVGLAYIMAVCIELAMGEITGSLAAYGAAFLAFVIICYFVMVTFYKVRDKVLMTAQANLCDDVMHQIEALEIADFRKRNTGEWLSALTNDVNMVSESYFATILELGSDAFGLIVSTILLVKISPILSVFVILIAVIQMIVPKVMGPRIAAAKSDFSKSAGSFSSTVSEHLQGYDILKSFHLTEYSLEVMGNANHEMERKRYLSRVISNKAHMMSYAFGNVSYIGLYFIGAVLVARGKMTLGALVGASQLAVYILGPLQTISGQISEILGVKDVIASLEEIKMMHSERNPFAEQIPVPQVLDILLGEMQILDVLDDLFQTRSDGKAAAVGTPAEEQVEIGDPILVARGEIALGHGQFIKITEHGKVQFVVDNHCSHLIFFVVSIIPHLWRIGKGFH